MSNASTIIKTLITEAETAKREFQQKAQASLKEAFVEFFTANPEVKTVKWSQYAPYFNDGDECVFNVHEPVFSNTTDHENLSAYGEYDGDEEDVWVYDGYSGVPVSQKTLSEIKTLSGILTNDSLTDVMEDLFGNHVQVTATIDGFDVSEYEHD